MKKQSEYYKYTQRKDLRETAREESKSFIKNETAFQLGHLPTEQAHPYTVKFSQTVQKNPGEGIRLLLDVDRDLPTVARRTFMTDNYNQLVQALKDAVKHKRRVCFSGCGSTGRLSMLLEEMWRQFWEDRSGLNPGDAALQNESDDINITSANLACSIMTGGDRALIRSVENFEDYAEFGRRQVKDLDLKEDDLLIAISEGGETSSVIGTAEEAIDRKCKVFFIFSNPAEILKRSVERSRRIIEHDHVSVIDLFSGSMALSGSTRMQATTLEMMVIGSALEEAFAEDRSEKERDGLRIEQANRLAKMVHELSSEGNLEILASLARRESDIYSEGGRVTYLATSFLLDIFSDTTERSPTFMLPAFRPSDDSRSLVSWAFAKNPRLSNEKAWFDMLRRSPRGIDWTSGHYQSMNAPKNLIDNPPSLGRAEINRYAIGMEDDVSRTEKSPYLFLQIQVGDNSIEEMDHCELLSIGGTNKKNPLHVALDLHDSPIRLWHHLALKLIFNTVSTASMGIMGRIRGNWMVQVDPTNKKLIDRASRIISHLGGISYGKACEELHLSLLAREALIKSGGSTTTSPVVDALDRMECE